MDKHTLLLSLYKGRGINQSAFKNRFFPNGADMYIHEELDEFDGVVYRVYAEISDSRVTSVSVYKADYNDCGHGRPNSVEKSPTSAQWKQIFAVLDECFFDQNENEVLQVINTALALKCSYRGYSIKKVLKNDVEFTTPGGKPVKLPKKRVSQAVAFSHSDISIIRKPEIAKKFSECLGKMSFEPLFAILSTIDPSTYDHYDSLNDKYRYKELLAAIANGDYESVKEFPDVLKQSKLTVSIIGREIANANNPILSNWFFEHVPSGSCSLNSMLYAAIEQEQTETVNIILTKQLYDPNMEVNSWRYPIHAALGHHEYILPLLQHGFQLDSLDSEKYLAKLSLDQLKALLCYRIKVSSEILYRIIEEQRYDVLQIIEEHPGRYCGPVTLIETYIEAKDYKRFKRGVENGWASHGSFELLKKAYAVSESWATLIIEHGFDINYNSGHLLQLTCRDLDADFAIYLMEHGADPHLKGEYSESDLAIAAGFHGYRDDEERGRQEKLCRYLLEKECDPIMESDRKPSIFTYMMSMSTEFKLHLIDWIAARGEINYYECKNDPNLSTRGLLESVIDRYGRHYDAKVFRALLKYGAYVDLSRRSDAKLFLDACSCCNLEDLKMFVAAGGNIQELDTRRKTNGLFAAVQARQSKDVIEYLISLGLDVNSMDPGFIPSTAIDRYYRHALIPPKTVLDVAESEGDQEIIELLKKHGAKRAEELVS